MTDPTQETAAASEETKKKAWEAKKSSRRVAPNGKTKQKKMMDPSSSAWDVTANSYDKNLSNERIASRNKAKSP